MKEKEMEKWIEGEYMLIKALSEKFPKDFLTFEHFRIAPTNTLIPIGLFMCRLCRIPINHHQYTFSGLCARCDLGKKSPKWKIEKPLPLRVAEEL